MVSDYPPDARQLAENLIAAVGAGERVNLINDHEPQVPEQPHEVIAPVDEHRLQRFRRDLQDAARRFEQFFLV